MKVLRISYFCLFPILGLSITHGQTPDPKPSVRSHVERFSTPEARAARTEKETTEKLVSEPNNAELLNNRALARLRLNKFQEAYDDLKKAISINPKNADYRANFGYALWKLGRTAEAVEAEREALKLDEKNYTANYQLGRYLLRSGDKKLLPEAAARLRKALEIDPRQYEVRFELLAVYRELGDTASALAQLDLLQEALPSDARVNYVAALLSVDRNDNKTALESFREALRKDQNLYGAWQDLGLLYVKQNNWSEAAKTFAELTKRQAGSPVAAYLNALALYNAGSRVEAETEARRALRLDPSAADAHTLLGIILAAKGNSDSEAIENLSQAATLAPNNFDALFYLGRLQYLNKDYSSAIKHLGAAVSLNKQHAEARFFLGTALEAAGDADAAFNQYQELTKLDSKSAYGQIGLGAIFLKQNKADEAITALKNALTLDGNNFEANWTLGRAFFLKENFTEALDALQKAVRLAPNRTDARYQLGLTLRRLGRNEEAAKEFATVEKLNREFREGKQ
jgi:tetratricopeptide (TPR) repeat protein